MVSLPLVTVVSTAPVDVVVDTAVVVEPSPEPPVVVAVAEAVRPSLYSVQSSSPPDWALMRSEAAVQALIRQGATRPAMAALDGPHWQPTSVGAQPAAVTAEERQDVCRGAC